MSYFSEHRLVHVLLTDINKIRQAGGAAPVSASQAGTDAYDTRNVDTRILPGDGGNVTGGFIPTFTGPISQGAQLAAANNGTGTGGTPASQFQITPDSNASTTIDTSGGGSTPPPSGSSSSTKAGPQTYQQFVSSLQGVGGVNDKTAQAAQTQAEQDAAAIANAKGYVKQVDKNGNESYVEDANATAAQQNEVRKQIAARQAADAAAQNAATQTLNGNKMAGGGDANTSNTTQDGQTSDPLAQSLSAPFDQYASAQGARLDQQKADSLSATQGISNLASKYFDNQSADNKNFADTQQAMLSNINAKQLDNAKLANQSQTNNENLAYQQAQMQYDREIRNQQLQNMIDRKQFTDGLGISGAWKSSRLSADVVNELQKGEFKLADIQSDEIFNTTSHASKLNDIVNTYTSNQNTAESNFSQGLLQLGQQVNAAAKDLNAQVFSTAKEQTAAVENINSTWVSGYNEIAKTRATEAAANTKWLIDNARNVRQEIRTQQDQLLSEYDRKVTAKGDNQGPDFRALEKRLADLGYDTTGMDTPFTTVSQYNAMRLQNLYDGLPAGGSPNGTADGSYNDDIVNVASRLSGGDKVKGFLTAARNLQSTGQKQALDDLINTNAIETLSPDARKTYDSKTAALSMLQRSLETLNSNVEFNKYKTYQQNVVTPYLASDKDQPWVQAIANLSNVRNDIAHGLYGSRLTETETKNLMDVLPDVENDTIGTIKTKLNTYENNLQSELQTTLQYARNGHGTLPSKAADEQAQPSGDDILNSYLKMKGLGQGSSSSSAASHPALSWVSSFVPTASAAEYPNYGPYANSKEPSLPSSLSLQLSPHSVDQWESNLNVVESQKFNSPIDYNIPGARANPVAGPKGEFHDGLDLSPVKGGRPDIPAFVGGKVYSIQTEKQSGGWGNTITIRDNAGNLHKYSHLESINPALFEDAAVDPGMIIGRMGNTGHTFSSHGGDGTHLDYRILGLDGKFKDPRAFEHNAIAYKNK